MKRFLLASAIALLPLGAMAQQPPEDGRIAIYRQLLTEANDRVDTDGGGPTYFIDSAAGVDDTGNGYS